MRNCTSVPLWLILLTLALVPAVFEELCFRGFLFGVAAHACLAGDRTVIASALLFGVFHEVLFPGRLLAEHVSGPSAGLGAAAHRQRAARHGAARCVHNGLLLTIAYYRDELIARGWGVEEQMHLPTHWLAAAVLGIVVGVARSLLTDDIAATQMIARDVKP